MEKFEITYRGKKIEATKHDNGDYSVTLPKRYGKDGSELSETISRDETGWCFSSSVVGNPEFFFNLWLRDDGKVAYRNSTDEELHVSDKPFDPKVKDPKDPLYAVTKEVYDVVAQFFEYEKLGIPASKINDLRKLKLSTALKLLGYSTTDEVRGELNDSASYFVLGRIGKQLEEYINLGVYVHNEGIKDGKEVLKVKLPEGNPKDIIMESARPVASELAGDRDFITTQDELLDRHRNFVEDHCMNMSRKVPYDDWQIYSSVVRKTAELLIELNYDIVRSLNKQGLPDYSRLTRNELADKISSLIDSREFSKATDIEDRFIIRETKRLERKVKSFEGELVERCGSAEVAKKSALGITLGALKEEALATRKERHTYSSQYNKMEKMYFSRMPKTTEDKTKEGVTPDDD